MVLLQRATRNLIQPHATRCRGYCSLPVHTPDSFIINWVVLGLSSAHMFARNMLSLPTSRCDYRSVEHRGLQQPVAHKRAIEGRSSPRPISRTCHADCAPELEAPRLWLPRAPRPRIPRRRSVRPWTHSDTSKAIKKINASSQWPTSHKSFRAKWRTLVVGVPSNTVEWSYRSTFSTKQSRLELTDPREYESWFEQTAKSTTTPPLIIRHNMSVNWRKSSALTGYIWGKQAKNFLLTNCHVQNAEWTISIPEISPKILVTCGLFELNDILLVAQIKNLWNATTNAEMPSGVELIVVVALPRCAEEREELVLFSIVVCVNLKIAKPSCKAVK